jgi:hypothetical protein
VRHPHAVDVTDMGTEGDQTFLVMELLDGEDLATRLGREGRLAIPELVDIMLPVCSAVAAAHAAGIIHRDLKPQNIFLARGASDLVPKVLDFGISKAQDTTGMDALTGTDAVIGTPYYLAPEQVTDSRTATPASDQYAIGVVLYECMTGVRPFQAESLYAVFHAIVTGNPVRPRERRPEIDAKFEAVALRAMAVSPEARFASVTALAQALWPFASERGRMLWHTFGSSQPGFQPAPRTPASSNETAVDDAVRTPRWPGRDAPAARTPVMAPSAPVPTPAARPPAIGTPLPATGGDAPVPRARPPFGMGVALVVLALGLGAIWYAVSRARGTDAASPAAVEPPPSPAPAAAAPAAPVPAQPAPPRRYDARVTVVPPAARIQLDGAPAGGSPFERTFAADGAAHTLVISADGFDAQTVIFQDAPPPPRIVLVARAAPESVPARTHKRPPALPKEVAPAPRVAPPAPAPTPAGPNNAPLVE